jgi:hypothetical protein
MPYPALKEKWRGLYGTEPPAYKREHMVRRLAYRIQELAYGGLADETKADLERIAEEDEQRRQGAQANRRKPKDTHPTPVTNGQLVLRSEAALRGVATVDIRVPMEFKTRGGRKEIISVRSPSGLPPDAAVAADVGPRSPLAIALARAYRWQRLIDSGEVPGMEAIAARYGVSRTYVARMLQFTSLAPAFVKAIVEGKEPTGMSLTKLRDGLPPMWEEQKRRWLHG